MASYSKSKSKGRDRHKDRESHKSRGHSRYSEPWSEDPSQYASSAGPSYSSVSDIPELPQIDDDYPTMSETTTAVGEYGSTTFSYSPYTAYPTTTTYGVYEGWSGGENVACSEPSCGQRFGNTNDRDRHYRTVHSNNGERPYTCDRDGCPAGVKSWTNPEKLRVHNNKWHGPYPCQEPGCSRGIPNGFGSQRELDEHHRDEHGGLQTFAASSTQVYSSSPAWVSTEAKMTAPDYRIGPNYDVNTIVSGMAQTSLAPSSSTLDTSRRISTKDPTTAEERIDPRYKVYPSHKFKYGLVFKVLWSEPMGNSNSKGTSEADISDSDYELMAQTKYGEGIHEKIRRFIVVGPELGHSVCLPILTYGGQGTLKRGVHPEHHAVIYTERPVLAKGERLTKKAIRIVPSSSRHRLDEMSRLNYAKVYTVEHNVKISPVGQVHKDSEWQLSVDYNAVHPQIVRGVPPSMAHDDDQPSEYQSYATPYTPTAIYPPSSTTTSTYYGTSGDYPTQPSTYRAVTSSYYPSSYYTTTSWQGPDTKYSEKHEENDDESEKEDPVELDHSLYDVSD